MLWSALELEASFPDEVGAATALTSWWILFSSFVVAAARAPAPLRSSGGLYRSSLSSKASGRCILWILEVEGKVSGSGGSSRCGRGAELGEVREFSRPTCPNAYDVAACGDVLKWSFKAACSAMVLLQAEGWFPASSCDDGGDLRRAWLLGSLQGLDCVLVYCLEVVSAYFQGQVVFRFLRECARVLFRCCLF